MHSIAHPVGAAAFVHPAGTLQAVGVGAEQSKLVVGGVVVQAQGCGAGDGMTAYVAGSLPHSHQPGPSVMAAQVFWGSAAWKHVTDDAPAELAAEGVLAELVAEGAGIPSHDEAR